MDKKLYLLVFLVFGLLAGCSSSITVNESSVDDLNEFEDFVETTKGYDDWSEEVDYDIASQEKINSVDDDIETLTSYLDQKDYDLFDVEFVRIYDDLKNNFEGVVTDLNKKDDLSTTCEGVILGVEDRFESLNQEYIAIAEKSSLDEEIDVHLTYTFLLSNLAVLAYESTNVAEICYASDVYGN